jgi:iron complex outermembrane receptor protein
VRQRLPAGLGRRRLRVRLPDRRDDGRYREREFPANINVHPTRTQRRFVVGADGKFTLFGKDWSYDAYAEHGENTTVIHVQDITLNPRYNFAIDAVATATGNIVCRSAAARAAGCQPINIFGNVPINMAGWNYIAPRQRPDAAHRFEPERR